MLGQKKKAIRCNLHRILPKWAALLIFQSLIFACSISEFDANQEDPFEPINRGVHQFNKAADVMLLRPASQLYDVVTDEEVQQRIAYAGGNLNEPRNVINHLLQGKVEPAAINATRFVFNSTVGFLGFYDPASTIGLEPSPTNFDETMTHWGVPPGPYVELPFFGPHTLRSVAGLVVDTQINPLTYYLTPANLRNYNYFIVLSRINDRARYGNLVDLILHDSPDSYLATRSAYLQNQQNQADIVTEPSDSDTVELEDFYDF